MANVALIFCQGKERIFVKKRQLDIVNYWRECLILFQGQGPIFTHFLSQVWNCNYNLLIFITAIVLTQSAPC